MKPVVFIPAAGIGSRLGDLTQFKNKSLLSISNKPVISHIIESFPKSSTFIIALGYKGEDLQKYIKIAHQNLKFKFIKIKNFNGAKSGLGYTLNQSKKYLQKSFIFCTCDTIIDGKIPLLNYNWVGYNKRDVERSEFRHLRFSKNNFLIKILEKNKHKKNDYPYIGLANISDYKSFWFQFEKNLQKSLQNGEVIPIQNMLDKKFKGLKFNWFDTGNKLSFQKTFNSLNSKKYNVLPKKNEDIWFINKKVIKFSSDKKFIKNRYLRAKGNKFYFPNTKIISNKMYYYNFIDGVVFSKIITVKNFQKLLNFSEKFWKKKKLSKLKQSNFNKVCLKFYKNKTSNRIKQFLTNENINDKPDIINNIKVPSLKKIFNNIDWKKLSKGVPTRFHGDFHFENILMTKTKFKFLDWRQDFGGLLNIGDLYYDLSKLMHGIIVNHEMVLQEKFTINKNSKKIQIKIQKIKNYKIIHDTYCKWLNLKKYDLKKVEIITALIFLNIAPLHHKPYNRFLFYLGKLMLFKSTNK